MRSSVCCEYMVKPQQPELEPYLQVWARITPARPPTLTLEEILSVPESKVWGGGNDVASYGDEGFGMWDERIVFMTI